MASEEDDAIWESHHVALNVDAQKMIAAVELAKTAVPESRVWKHHERHVQAAANFSMVVLVYIAGFDAIHRGSSDVQVSPEMTRWVRLVRGHRSASTLAAMNAAAHVSGLEGFLRSLARAHLSDRVLDRLRRTYQHPKRNGGSEPLHADRDAACRQIDMWLKPTSGRNFDAWVRLVRLAFACDIDDVIVDTMRDMIAYRHSITHPDELLDETAIVAPGGARLSCWGLVAHAWSTHVALGAVHDT